jgi:hypothetical protein
MVVDSALIKEAYCQRVNIETDQKIKGNTLLAAFYFLLSPNCITKKSLPCVIGVVDTSR